MKKLLGVFIVLIFLGCNSEYEMPLDLKEVVNERSYVCLRFWLSMCVLMETPSKSVNNAWQKLSGQRVAVKAGMMKKLLGGLCLLPITCIIVFIVYHSTGEDLMNILYVVLFAVGFVIITVLTGAGLRLLGINW